MICPRCGSWIDEGEPYCPGCSWDGDDEEEDLEDELIRALTEYSRQQENLTDAQKELIKIIEEDTELLPNSKKTLKSNVQLHIIETLQQLKENIQLYKDSDGTMSNSTLATEEELIKIIEEDTELLPNSKKTLKSNVQLHIIETLQQLKENIQLYKDSDGTMSNSTIY